MAGKRGKLDDASKMTILTMIRDRKDVLFGIFTSELDNASKKQAWVDILVKAQSIGACNSSRTWEFVRDSMWGNWKSRTLGKRDNANKTGRGEGKDCVMTPVDDIILDIIGRDTPCVKGLGLPQTGDVERHTETTRVSEMPQELQNRSSSPDPPIPASSSGSSADLQVQDHRRNRKTKEADLLQRKRKLQVELLELEIYQKQLVCYGMEKSLRIEQSELTKTLKPNNSTFVVPSTQP